MRLTVRTNLAMRTLMFCAVNPGRTVTKSEIAAGCNASAAHLGVVINQLAHAGFVRTIRGRNGGICLTSEPDQIRVGDIFREFEAATPFAECFAGEANECPLAFACKLRGALCRALDAFYAELDRITLADLTADNPDLTRLLALEPA